MSFDALCRNRGAMRADEVRALCAAEVGRPGPFQGAALYVPYLWSAVLDGGADEWHSLPDTDTTTEIVGVDQIDRNYFPELAGVSHVALWADTQGFIYSMTFDTRERLDGWLSEQIPDGPE